jgi:maltose O-acetyltransferase
VTTPGERESNSSVAETRTERQKMLAGELYLSSDPELQAAMARSMRLTEAYNQISVDELDRRSALLHELLGSFGTDSVIRPPFNCDYGSNITMGDRSFANFGLVALDCATITIGDDVQMGPNVQLLTPTHPLDADERRAGWEAALPIRIGNNVWLGGGVIVLPGVTIGRDAVVGAGAVVTRDVEPSTLVVGNPARPIRNL